MKQEIDEMREEIEHTMTEAQLERFLSANGLRRDGKDVLAPEGRIVGLVWQVSSGPLAVLMYEEWYRFDGGRVQAWWPAFRPAWTLFVDGEVEVGELLGPDEVICDVCNAAISIRPVPVVGTYAHCAGCFARLGIRFPGGVAPYAVGPCYENSAAEAALRGYLHHD